MKRGGIVTVLLLSLMAFGMWAAWMWFFCRFYVEPGEMAIVVAKTGTPLPEGQMLAQDGQQGIREKVLGEGRHFLNPYLNSWEIREATMIPPGKVGLVTAKVGKNLPEGEFIASPGQKGILRGVLGPGRYRLNPYGYNVDIIDATSIPIGYVGVVSSQAGEQSPVGEFAGPNQKGTRRDILQPGLYYVNPKELKVDVLEIGVNQVSLLGEGGGEVITKNQVASGNKALEDLNRNIVEQQQAKRSDYITQNAANWKASAQQHAEVQTAQRGQVPQGTAPETPVLSFNQQINFPSRDGFTITLDMTVEFEFTPSNIAWIYRSYGDLPKVVDTIILPQIASISRLRGSQYGAKDFIVGEGRERFQTELTESLARTLAEKKITIHNALIRHVNVPDQILTPIQDASVAVEQDLTNKEKQNTAKKQAELNTEMGLIDQQRETVTTETVKMRAEIKAEQEKSVAELQAETQKQVAEIAKQTADVFAEKTRVLGKAKAQIVQLVEGEQARGLELRAKAFRDPIAFAQYEFATKLNESLKLNVIHAGPGTLWTDLDKARLGDFGAAKAIQPTK